MFQIEVAAAIIIANQSVLIAQRPLNKHKGGLWEFPGGKIESGESDLAALKREIAEEINLTIDEARLVEEIHYQYPEKEVVLKFFQVTQFYGDAKGLEGQPVRWVPIGDLEQFDFPEANQPIVEKLMSGELAG